MPKQTTLVLTLLAALALGCGKETTYKTKDGEVTVDKKGGQMTIESKSKEGTVKVTANESGVALPDNFPKDVPVVKGGVVKVAATQGKTMMVHLQAPMALADAAKFYQDELKSGGWNIESTMNLGDGSLVVAKKGNRQCSVVINKDGKETVVQLSVTQD